MESKKAVSQIIRNWIKEAADEDSENVDSLRADASERPAGYAEKGATVEKLGECFLELLRSANGPSFYEPDWKVGIRLPDRDKALCISSAANELSVRVYPAAYSDGEKLDARLSIPYEELRQLINFETDYVSVMARNKRLDNPDKPFVRPISDLLFAAYNAFYLKPVFRNTLVEKIYSTGKVANLSGVERFIYPWAISADIGNVLYDLITEHEVNKSLEIGLAYGLSTLFMCQAHKNKNYGCHTAIDPCQSVEFQSIGVDQIKKANLVNHFRLLEEKDYDILPALLKAGEKFGFIFIDGLHMHDYVVLDYFYGDLLLEQDGLLAFDDCHAPGVSSAVAYLEKNRNYRFLDQYSDHRLRVYRKLSEDRRTINSPNHHIEYFQKYRELSVTGNLLEDGAAAKSVNAAKTESVAIVGIDGVFPKASGISEFWQSIIDEKTLYDRYSPEYLYSRDPKNLGEKSLIGGMLESPFEFDPDFFRISHSEAEMMDPQLRQLLMSTYRSIEDSGHTLHQLSHSRVGVFVGTEGSDYNELHRSRAVKDGYFLNHSGSSLANRLSYFFDFKGPSEVVNTMCSSGAFCLYRATELLRKKEIDFAIVGAVKINFSDVPFQSLNELNITSTKPDCYSFHRNSAGYIRSEGVVTLVLTSAENASTREDFVYAHIKEIAVNFNGKDGNSMFSPSKNGQKQVMKDCYGKAGVAMMDISYVEAQGMGNVVSDFVEFNAINEAYDELLVEEGGAKEASGPAISTIKPILGHMECVSALGALLKVLLTFKTGTVYRIPRLDPNDINPKLDAENKHCRLLTESWRTKTGRPMLAALNSFGASGTNVHIVLEQSLTSVANPESEDGVKNRQEQLLIVSARTKRGLQRYIENIGGFLDKNCEGPVLHNLCYTFQLRREHHEHRAVFYIEPAPAAAQAAQLRGMLSQYLSSHHQPAPIRDNLKNSDYHYTSAAETQGIQNNVLFDDGLAWLSGMEIDWKMHHADQPPKTGGLPVYPFDLENYKLNLEFVSGQPLPGRGNAYIHPLLQGNTSDFSRQSYSSLLSGQEFFLTDHRVHGQSVLPAVAYLEMARAAVTQAARAPANQVLELQDIVWMQPFVVAQSRRVGIALFEGDGAINFEIYDAEPDTAAEAGEIMHCQGRAVLASGDVPDALQLERLQQEMRQGRVDPTDLYNTYSRMGIGYGPAHRGVTAVYKGERQLLVRVSLPKAVVDTRAHYLLHPSLLDSALQAGIVLSGELDQLPNLPALPFALESIRVISTCPTDIYAWVRRSESRQAGGVIKLDADLCDLDGKVCVQIRGFSSRLLEQKPELIGEEKVGALLSREAYADQTATSSEDSLHAKAVSYFQTLIAQTLKTSPQKIEPSCHFSEYGLDSILVVQLTNQLREVFSGITSTLFFEVQSVDGLVNYFLQNRRAELAAVIRSQDVAAGQFSELSVDREQEAVRTPSRSRPRFLQPVPVPVAGRSVFDVAIIGLSGRYPQAKNLSEFWKNLSEGVNCITEIPRDRWKWEDFYDAEKGKPGKIYSKWGGFMEGIDKFDPLFFKITPYEAERLDPQERLFLESCYHAIEDAGYTPAALEKSRKIGVFVGVTNSMYTNAPEHFSFANRISYLFNFQGPSMAVDTACSSSLTAVHLALESIYSGLSTCAIAGGVNVLIDPAHYMRLAETAALSADNHCKAFGEHADGFIDAEGVGAVVLKPLKQAEHDGDHIYGVIKGSSINAGGKTNGYTVPSPLAQSTLVTEALQRAGVPAERLSYIETHGTGTPLGDPIEIAGLTRAFRETTDRKQFCAIGSLKSNIGHCEASAGIAGLTKVLLQLKHGLLAPSLHSKVTNAEIDFSQTPFRVQQVLEEWKRLSQDGFPEIPRTAGVSSFGIGGANAHIIVQEYIPRQYALRNSGSGNKVIIPLSARTVDQLRQKARDLRNFIRVDEQSSSRESFELPAMAYTLQSGREAMDERLGFIVSSIDELAEQLDAYLEDRLDVKDAYQGRTKENKDTLTLFSADTDLQETVDKWIKNRKLSKLLELWVRGLELDWDKLYPDGKPRRVSLPLYPFARERYWIDRTSRAAKPAHASSILHPLLHSNTSDLSRQSYSSTLTGEELFLADHQVQGQKVLPAVAYLEMARAAVASALPEEWKTGALELSNIVWGQPLVVAGSKRTDIVLFPNGNGQIEYEISTWEGGQETLHCQGLAAFSTQPGPAKLNLAQLEEQMNEPGLDIEELYAGFAKMGINLGAAHRAVGSILRGDGQLLAWLKLPAVVKDTDDYVLHPSLMDGALQCSLGLIGDLDHSAPLLPFALDSLRIAASCTEEMLAWVRYSSDRRFGGSETKLDIDICDQQGQVCVQMRGFMVRALRTNVRASLSQDNLTGTVLAVPVWQTASVQKDEYDQPRYTQQFVVLCELPQINSGDLEALLPASRCMLLQATPGKNIAQRYEDYALACFDLVQKILTDNPDTSTLIQLVVADTPEQRIFSGLSALLKTGSLENPRLNGRIILIDPQTTMDRLAAQLAESTATLHEAVVRYQLGVCQVLRWQEMPEMPRETRMVFKNRGVYLITGGLGGLGILFAKEILQQIVGVRIILTGRASLDDQKKDALETLRVPAATVEYRQLDFADLDQVNQLIADIKKEYGQLNGILHSAGMIADSFILKKTPAEFSQVLEPKVTGTCNLDLATQDIDLDFLVLFSSGAATTGNIGQADYATANAFMDRFADYRNHLVASQQRRGQTLSINWPLWQEGGMNLDQAGRDMMRQVIGMSAMKTVTGLRAFYRGLQLRYSQMLVMEGDLAKIRRTLLMDGPAQTAPLYATPPGVAPVGTEKPTDLVEKTQAYLSGQFSTLFKLPPHEIDPRAPFEQYGIDSILAMKLTHQLEEVFGFLPKTLFFEYQTLRQLAGYFAKRYPEIVLGQTGKPVDAPPVNQSPVNAMDTARLIPSPRRNNRFVDAKHGIKNGIAIVGLAGRYPKAANLEEFWDNLKNGRDCVTEIPLERWDYQLYFDPARNRPGKSYSKWGGFLEEVDKFDSLFFNISPREAELIDPQERLFLETVWETVEDAGYSKEHLALSRVGIYVGVMWGQYELFGAAQDLHTDMIPSSSYASIANRVSYFFNFNGPSIALDTMCSSSLTAIHLACEAIRGGEIDVAIAGGVNVSIHPNKYLNLAQGNFASSDGKCRSFGAGGDGYVPGEGVGAVLLKSLEQALLDGDQVYAVIKGSAINHGGKTNGYSVPNPNAQGNLILDALKKAEIDPRTLGYIETHGTGTSLGDPIEIAGLTKAFEPSTQDRGFCAIGSVKSNIGHLEAAAGIAAVTKALLQIKNEQMVPSLHAEPANPNINFAESPFYVQTTLRAWQRPATHPRRIGISSFGAGGANAHLILEEHAGTQEIADVSPVRPEAFVLSARDRAALRRYAEKVAAFLERNPNTSLANAAHTSQVGRTAFGERLVVVAATLAELTTKLKQWAALPEIESPRSSAPGSQHIFHGNVTRAQSSGADTLIEGEAGKAFLQVILDTRNLEKIAKLWIAGVDIDWSLLHYHTRPKRISLPTYPFARERYWIRQQALPFTEERKTPFEQPLDNQPVTEPKQRLYYKTKWAETALAPDANIQGPVIVMGASDELFAELKQRLDGADSIIRLSYHDEYKETEPGIFAVSAEREEHFQALVQTLKERGQFPSCIVHYCPIENPPIDDHSISRQLNYGVYALVHMSKALMKQKSQMSVRILSVFESGEGGAPLHGALGGFFRTMALENPKYLGTVVEIRSSSTGPQVSAEQKAAVILDELQGGNRRAAEVRYQEEQHRLVRRVRQLLSFDPSAGATRELPVKENGVYIISGGLGGLGFIFSEYLAKNFRCKLVLFGRSPLGAAQEKKLLQLQSLSAEILYLKADASVADDMESVVRQAKARFSQINGVIHCAGTNKDAFILKKLKEEMASVIDPKVRGAIYLDQATQTEDLDLFVVFSSLAGVFGNSGQCDYSYANHFLDAFAASREELRREGKRSGMTLSINWSLWNEGGMTVSQNDIALAETRTGICALPTEEGIRYWEDLLRSGLPQGIALYGIASQISAHIARDQLLTAPELPSTATDPGVLLEKTQAYLKVLIGEEIRLAPQRIDSTERFEAFGIDSMMINRFNANLERDLGPLPKTLLYEYETIEELATYLAEEVGPALARLFGLHDSEPKAVAPMTSGPPTLAQETFPLGTKGEDCGPIAIIGVHANYPGSTGIDEFWENLKQGRNLIDLVPESRWDREEYYHPDPEKAVEGKIYCKWGGFLEDVDAFDPHFFNISADEARNMDPQERLFIQSVWAAIEDAGYTRDVLKKRYPKAKSADAGVFVGVTTNSYNLLAPEELQRGNMVSPAALPWSIANRVSYFFDFQGPSMPVDTACSSSLVAIHLACESLRKQECRIAIAGGVNLYLHPSKYQHFCMQRMVSLSGKCRSFSGGDDGFVPGEGIGTLVLKPLHLAVEDRDNIYAVIRASAFDHSGRSNGYSAPNPNSQAGLIARTLTKAGVHPESIGYIEGHGTGTQLGDSLEIAALAQAFGRHTAKKQFCAVGSVKANIGHSESAAGIAGVVKVLLQFKHRQLAPTIHADEPNPNIDFPNSPFYLQHELTLWEPSVQLPRRALVNSFGAGGVNACVLLDEYVGPNGAEDFLRQVRGPYLVVLSAKNESQLCEYAGLLLAHLRKDKSVALSDLSYTLQTGREAMHERLAVVVSDPAELISRLDGWSRADNPADIYRGSLDPRRGKRKRSHEAEQRLKAALAMRDLATLAELWVAGEELDWEMLHAGHRLNRISLPTYPFARERYWVTQTPSPRKSITPSWSGALHPLVTYNSSTLSEVSFSSILSDKEFYALDHRVNQSRIFPGVGFIEMACISGNIAGEKKVSHIRDIIWVQPLSFEKGPQTVRTLLKPIGNSTEFEIISLNEENERVVHSEGRLFFQKRSKAVSGEEKEISIEALKKRATKFHDGAHYYKLFGQIGLDYGPTFQPLWEFYIGDSYALAKLTIPDPLKSEFDRYILHPSMIDGALQTVAGLIGDAQQQSLHLPFAIDEVDIISALPHTCYAYAEYADLGDKCRHGGVKKFNINLLSENGDVLVRLKNFYVREFVTVGVSEHAKTSFDLA